jgi:hypothetical protein
MKKRGERKEHLLFDSIRVNFQNRQNLFMVTEITELAVIGGENSLVSSVAENIQSCCRELIDYVRMCICQNLWDFMLKFCAFCCIQILSLVKR